jgi:hypothetical protein
MQSNPLEEWQSLTEVYSQKYDGELLELAADSADLTEVAQQVLRDEMKKRGLDWPGAADNPADQQELPPGRRSHPGIDLPDAEDAIGEPGDGESDPPREYTWKTLLRACESLEQAWQISEVLRRAGIESWVERSGSKHAIPWDEWGVGDIQVQVAADQLDQARAIAAQPIPQDIIDESHEKPAEFELPACPHCGASDPVLENADPVNAWKCEACGNEWTEPAADQNQGQAGD